MSPAVLMPSPFQRDLSATHAKRMTEVIDKLGRFLDPVIAVRSDEGHYWTPNGLHRLTAMKALGAKSIVKITLTAGMPPTTWNRAAPDEYGFYANVNPAVPHPRWSQATEQRIGESGRRKTLPFNGYADQVASLYAGMDLRADF